MRLLIITQKVDSEDATLGFFHGWLAKISLQVESIEVICLEKGTDSLPLNVHVYSLGKERRVSKAAYFFNFYRHLARLEGSYDAVFVHMNQEYLLLAGWYWKLRGTPVFFWRNHPYGNFLTRLAIFFSAKVFCTSSSSFSARFKRTTIMPVGVDTEMFSPKSGIVRKKYSVCMVGRIAPVKGIDIALEAIHELVSSGAQVSLSIVGSPLEKHFDYFDTLKTYVTEHNLASSVSFRNAVPPRELPDVYSEHEICLNLTLDGSFDKTIVEAAACGAIPIVTSPAVGGMLPSECRSERTAVGIARSISRLLDPREQILVQDALKKFVEAHSLKRLMVRLIEEMHV